VAQAVCGATPANFAQSLSLPDADGLPITMVRLILGSSRSIRGSDRDQHAVPGRTGTGEGPTRIRDGTMGEILHAEFSADRGATGERHCTAEIIAELKRFTGGFAGRSAERQFLTSRTSFISGRVSYIHPETAIKAGVSPGLAGSDRRRRRSV
jgi:hypothetical protein